ncbi:Uroporphyrinogen-III synthase HemD [Calidithermus terrae]|uniref:Uroporphyrinogen-III synthase HemD n=1 Tax=Calidithermus terrae TaxID=1408545 RepID=A0A399EG15_9DEIN|nr:uroporphyrinogen-III synthase [Calidithermus terrae]RIH82089.1 Uroporphyrinogen-III synthase HemD [Calidithermus terrae]
MKLSGLRFALCGPRRAEDLALILQKQGATALFRPTVQTVLAEPPALEAQLRKFAQEGADWVIFTTGAGLEELAGQAGTLGLWEAVRAQLERSRIALRGYKAGRALERHGLEAAVEGEDGTVEGLIEALQAHAFAGRRVFLQLYGQPAPRLVRFLQEQGAQLEELLPYRHLPAPEAELTRLLEEILARQLDAVVFTSVPQVEHLLGHARGRGRLAALGEAFDAVWALAIGRVTAKPLREAGIRVWHPQTERIGALVTEFAAFRAGGERLAPGSKR